MKQYVEGLSGEHARRQAGRSSESAIAAEVFMNNAGKVVAVGCAGFIACVLWLFNKPPTAPCPAKSNVATEIQAAKVVVKPWKGPHQVYALFNVPLRYKDDRLYSTHVRVQGYVGGLTSPEPEYVNAVSPDPGSYLKQIYLPTRLAGWFLATGRFGDLVMPCNWTLVVSERRPGQAGTSRGEIYRHE